MSVSSQRLWLTFVLGGLLGLFLASSSTGQQFSKEKLTTEENETLSLRMNLMSGKEPFQANDKRHQRAVEVAAKRVLYPYDFAENQRTPRKMYEIFERFEKDLNQLASGKEKTTEVVPVFTTQVIKHALPVIEQGKPIAQINATRTLARLVARGTSPHKQYVEEIRTRLAGGNAKILAETLANLASSPANNEGVKYYALVGLHDLLKAGRFQPDPLPKDVIALAVKAAQPLAEANAKFPQRTTFEEINGFRTLRKQALSVLAETRILGSDKGPAIVLMRVVGKDSRIVPEPRLDERLEAAIGLASVRPEADQLADYHADYAAYQIARFLSDFSRTAGGEGTLKSFQKSRPWKTDAARLRDALNGMRAELKQKEAEPILDQCLILLTNMETGKDFKPEEFGDWLSTTKIGNTSLLRRSPNTNVQ